MSISPLRIPRTVLLALVVAVALAGCGGESKSGSKRTSTASGGGKVGTATCENVNAKFAGTTDPAKVAVADRNDMFESAPTDRLAPDSSCVVRLTTNKGAFDIHVDAEAAPIAASNFVFLARSGYFNGIVFHRIIKNFMVQTGDPTGTGTGGPGYQLKDDEVVGTYARGTVAMANAGPDTGGSQFFIVHGTAVDEQLPKDYIIFGTVDDAGMKIVDAIASVPVVATATGEVSAPKTPVKIVTAELV